MLIVILVLNHIYNNFIIIDIRNLSKVNQNTTLNII